MRTREVIKEKFENIVSLLRYFVESRRYTIVDRVSNALNADSVREALMEALRIATSSRDRAIHADIKKNGGEVYSLICCDYGKDEGPGINGVFIKADDKELEGRKGYCVPCPSIPSEDEVREFLTKVSEDLTIAKDVAILAHTRRPKSRKSEGGEV